jgi:hypothetical protein
MTAVMIVGKSSNKERMSDWFFLQFTPELQERFLLAFDIVPEAEEFLLAGRPLDAACALHTHELASDSSWIYHDLGWILRQHAPMNWA